MTSPPILASQRGPLLRRLQQATGLVAEVRAEGLALVDPEGELTDEKMPAEGTEGHLALLMAERLADAGPEGVALEAVEAWIQTWQAEYRRYWRKSACEPGAAHGLARQALARLAALSLVRRRGGHVIPLPALGRFRVRAAALPDASDGTRHPQHCQSDLAEPSFHE